MRDQLERDLLEHGQVVAEVDAIMRRRETELVAIAEPIPV